MSRRVFGAWMALLWCASWASALTISSQYSPLNGQRAIRQRSDTIVLHTTEAPLASSLKSVRKYGECHYLIAPNGHVYRIVERKRVAYHAGRSMWDGRTNMDKSSVGIEVVGYHNKPITAAQYRAVTELLADLQGIYSIPDERVLTHSMVAYGAPNRWHKRSHRGRKRCGMQFARWTVREQLGLLSQPRFDPDVKAGRLVVGDTYLAKVLYGTAREQDKAIARFTSPDVDVIAAGRSAWDIARDRYNSADVLYAFPDGALKRGNEITNWKAMPPGTRVHLDGAPPAGEADPVLVLGQDGATAREAVGDAYNDPTTFYLTPDGRVRNGTALTEAHFSVLPAGTRILVGYTNGGKITPTRHAFDICGMRWNDALTLYRLPDGTLRRGNSLRETAIPCNATVFYRN